MKKLFCFVLAIIVILASLVDLSADACTAFYCVNSCGAPLPSAKPKQGYKLIVAVNRDEAVERPTLSAGIWPPKKSSGRLPTSIRNGETFECDQSKLEPPYNICVYGPLDTAVDSPPNYYSTWLGINERGSVGNLLFYMQTITRNTTKGRGIIASDFLIDSSWPSSEEYMQHLMTTRLDFGPFNYVQVEMSNKTGRYSLYLISNSDDSPYQRVISDEDFGPHYFAISNSDLTRPFNKVVNGNRTFRNLVEAYAEHANKQRLVEGILGLLQDTTENFPDPTLAEFMRKDPSDMAVRGVSRINGNYFGYWSRAHTRTSTVIMVDYNDNVEYYEYNLTSFMINASGYVEPGEWVLNSFKFKLKPLYEKFTDETNSGVRIQSSILVVLSILIILIF